MNDNIVWTKPIIDELLFLSELVDNLTYEEIAERMTHKFQMPFTKNACIGKARRLKQPPRPAKLSKGRPSRATLVPIDAPIPPRLTWRNGTTGISIYQLNHHRCHWPLAEVEDRPPYLYCGKPVREGSPWCESHCKRVYGLRYEARTTR